MKQRFLSACLSLLLTLTAAGQPYCNIKSFNLRDGLASNVITGLVQTPDQLMWFATWNGLACYDGYHFTTFRDQEQQRVLTTNRLLNIKPSQTGNLWCITYDLNPFFFDRSRSQFVDIGSRIRRQFGIDFHTQRALPMKNGHTWLLNMQKGGPVVRVDDRNIDSDKGFQLFDLYKDGATTGEAYCWVLEDADGDEWLCSDKGVQLVGTDFTSPAPYRFLQQVGQTVYLATNGGTVSQFDKPTRRLTRLAVSAQDIRNVTAVADRWLLIVGQEQILVYDTQRRTQRVIACQPLNPRALLTDSRHRLWVVADDQQTVIMSNLDTGEQALFSSADCMPLVSQSSQTFLFEDKYQTVWLATARGFFGYFDEQQRRLVCQPLRQNVAQPMIERWTIDQQGNLWFAGGHNLALACPHYRHITHISDLQEVRSIMFDSQGRIWAGNLAGDIAIYTTDGQRQGFVDANGRLTTAYARFSTHIYSLQQDQQGRVWIGTKGDGLYCLQTDGTLSHYLHSDADPYSLPSNQVYATHQDRQGRIWVGTFEKGICLFEPSADGQARFLSATSGLKGYPIEDFHKVRRITETRDGTIIVSASNGLVTFSEKFSRPEQIKFYAHKHVPNDSTSLLTSDVMQTLATTGDTAYVATVGGGMQRLSTAGGLLSDRLQFHTVRGMLSDYGTVLTLSEDRQQNLWIGRENSINMLEHKTGQLWRFGPNFIGEDTEMTEALPATNPATGQIALATTDGFLCFRPERLQEDLFTPPLVFTGVQLHGEQEQRQLTLDNTLEVRADQRNLTIQFAALDYQDNYMIRYAYKLEGVDRDWNYLGSEHSISFSNLPHGHHRLLVRSTNGYGTWADNTAALSIYAHPTFWETWWAVLLYVLLGLGVVGVAVWIYRLHTRASMERKLNDMKTQFFTDVSHKLRTPLTLIGGPVTQVLQAGGLTDVARTHLEMVERNAHRMLDLVNKMLTYSKEHHTYISDTEGQQAHQAHPQPLLRGGEPDYLEAETGDIQDGMATATSLPVAGDEPGRSVSSMADDSPRLLIVEDNDDLRAFLVSILQSDYRVLQAANGREGLELAEKEQPDFILTDVMMPEMDGLTMVHRIKANTDISHIPIVILSAKASMDDRLEGLKAGVNDYITKPFSATYLKQRMQNIIANQRMLQQNYLSQIKPSPQEEGHTLHLKAVEIVDSDKEMMNQLLDYIDQNIANPDLKIEDLASAVCLGRTVFYNKVKTLVGMSPVELLRHIRIQRAEEMVAKSNEPFSQIAYAVGFSDSRYFGKCFKKQTGLTPSDYREQHVE